MKRFALDECKKLFIEEIKSEAKLHDESRYIHRLHALLLVANGLSAYQVSDMIGISPRTIENWINLYMNAKHGHGLNAIWELGPIGRRSQIAGIEDKVAKDLKDPPPKFGFMAYPAWNWKALQRQLVAKYHKKKLGRRQCERIFQKLSPKI